MPPESNYNWTDLFQPAGSRSPSVRLQWRVLKKGGRPFLILPDTARLAVQGLNLYPAQTAVARAAKALLRFALRAGLSVAGQRANLSIPTDDELWGVLAKATGSPISQLPPPAILAGNPAAPGRRFVLLAFDQNEKPAAVLKAGLGKEAGELIEKETAILSALPKGLPGAPGLRGSFQSLRLHVLAQDFFAGEPPRTCDPNVIGAMLGSWLDTERKLPLRQAPAWQRLEEACRASSVFSRLENQLGERLVHPAIYHGDFAPWNVKVAAKHANWKVLDWERGELAGVPAWDWFHYVIQYGILGRRLAVPRLIREVETLLGCEPFRDYAGRADIKGIERHLMLTYLLYNNEVIRPAEGREAARLLLESLSSRWETD